MTVPLTEIMQMEAEADRKASRKWDRDKNPVEWILNYNYRLTEISNYVMEKEGKTMEQEYEDWQAEHGN